MLFDKDGNALDSKLVSFKTMEGCIYCPDGVCECEVSKHRTQLPISIVISPLHSNLFTKLAAILLKYSFIR